MAPQTRRARTIATDKNKIALKTSTQTKHKGGRGTPQATIPDANLEGGRKRTNSTMSNNTPNTPTNLVDSEQATSQAPPNKKPRSTGPPGSRPMQLQLVDSEVTCRPEYSRSAENNNEVRRGDGHTGTRSTLRRTSSFYPGRGDVAVLPISSSPPADLDDNQLYHDGNTETEDDSYNDDERDLADLAELAKKHPTKFQATVRLERPSSKGHAGSFGSPTPIVASASRTSKSQRDVSPEDAAESTWPADTNLCLRLGSPNLSLIIQNSLIRLILTEAISAIWAALMFEDAFPECTNTTDTVEECLFMVVKNLPGASIVHDRLMGDSSYKKTITDMLRKRIPLFRSDVKARCALHVKVAFIALNHPVKTRELVKKQLDNYVYIFPTGMSINSVASQIQPYRNDRIISVIRELYFKFNGGAKSFAAKFDHRFPTFRGPDGVTRREVPIAMVALVATALYVSLSEWGTGHHTMIGFLGGRFYGIYKGHIDSLERIRDKRSDGFHNMMSDIYAQASQGTVIETNTIQPLEFDLDRLE